MTAAGDLFDRAVASRTSANDRKSQVRGEQISCELENALPADVIVSPPSMPPAAGPLSIASLADALAERQGKQIFHVRLGIVCMTKKPISFERWLDYHVRVLSVERFYLRVEDTPELQELLGRPPWRDKVRALFHTDTVRDWEGQTSRQRQHVLEAIQWAREDQL